MRVRRQNIIKEDGLAGSRFVCVCVCVYQRTIIKRISLLDDLCVCVCATKCVVICFASFNLVTKRSQERFWFLSVVSKYLAVSERQ